MIQHILPQFSFLIPYLCYMSSIVVNPKSPQELQFLAELLKKLGVDSKVLSDEDTEDLGLSVLMKDVDRTDLASNDEVMAKLKG